MLNYSETKAHSELDRNLLISICKVSQFDYSRANSLGKANNVIGTLAFLLWVIIRYSFSLII